MRKELLWTTMLILLSWVTRAQADVLQGFESNSDGWFSAAQVASGTHGITSKTGNGHAESTYGSYDGGGAAYTFWDPLDTIFPGSTTSIDIYLDLNCGVSNDARFDWDSSLLGRDYVFNGGYYDDIMDPTGDGPRFVFSASTNGGRPNSYPKDPNHNPFSIFASGWYTFQHHFSDDNGTLQVDMTILDANGNTEHTWTIHSGDVVDSTCCQNFYGWFDSQEFPYLAFDNAGVTEGPAPVPVPEPASLILLAAGLAGAALKKRLNRGL